MILAVVTLVAGLALLTLGADRFVLSAIRLSRALGLSTVLIGALVVGFGTSAPEFLVSGLAAARGEIDLALGNVIGSNTANMTLVLGASALVVPIASRLRTVRREGVLMLVAGVVIAFLLWDLSLKRWEAAVLAGGMVVASILMVVWSKADAATTVDMMPGDDTWRGPLGRETLIGLATLGVTLLGAELLVRGASHLAEAAGLSSAFVGLVIVSVGTSLPELATGIASARRNETDLVLGNVLGSNIFNSLAVAGMAGSIGPGVIDVGFRNAIGFMIAAAVMAGLFVTTGRRLERWEGAVLLSVFIGFVAISA